MDAGRQRSLIAVTFLLVLVRYVHGAEQHATRDNNSPIDHAVSAPAGMVWVLGGEFAMR